MGYTLQLVDEDGRIMALMPLTERGITTPAGPFASGAVGFAYSGRLTLDHEYQVSANLTQIGSASAAGIPLAVAVKAAKEARRAFKASDNAETREALERHQKAEADIRGEIAAESAKRQKVGLPS